MSSSTASTIRPLPEVTPENQFYWTAGRDGVLRILRCRNCQYWVNPPGPICPQCRSSEVEPAETSGQATVVGYTVNHQQWYPELEVPYVVAVVELPEQVGLRLVTNIVGCSPDEVRADMPVTVTFVQVEDVWIPVFEPAEA
ncbi:MAG TPA: OB-fold domain-containing protein [Mycobacteriales bacterium]|jgi:uncharacterized OB-fold protein|nr:OB-fold domain-containing protein [Mycobacteriales bacterium]